MSEPIIHAVIAEDELILAAALEQALQRLWPELRVDAVAADGIAAMEQIVAQLPDIVFLDIKMPGKTGVEVVQELAEEWPDNTPFPLVVFVTAYDDYALQAFDHAAVDYVLKPISDARLSKTVERLKLRLTRHKGNGSELERVIAQLRALTPAAAVAKKLTMIRAAVGNQVRMIPLEDVVYFEATDKYVNVVTEHSESLIRMSLKELMPQLDERQFWQIHRGTVVNARRIQMAVRDEAGKLSVKLNGCANSLPVSRIYVHLFRQM